MNRKLSYRSFEELFLRTIKNGENAMVDDNLFLSAMGLNRACSAGQLWGYLVKQLQNYDQQWITPFLPVLDLILGEGTLSSRIVKALGEEPGLEQIKNTYRAMGGSLLTGSIFRS